MARPTLKDLNLFARTYRFFVRLCTNFGWRFVVTLLSAFVGVKGVLYTLGIASYLPYIRFKVGVTEPTRYQAFITVSRLPWALKAMIGMVSDLLPVAGLHKRYYILGSSVMGTAASVLLAAAPIRRWGGGVVAAMLLFLVSLESATVDLLIQGVYARMMVAKPETGADLVSAVWIFIQFGTLAASGLVGIFADKDPSLFFWVSLPFAAQIILPIAAGWLPEDPAVRGAQKAKWQANKKYFGLAVLMSAGALGLGAASLWGSAVVQAAYSITISAVLCAASLWLLPRQMTLSRTWYRRAFWTTTVVQVVAAIIDIAIVERWNRRAGISDKVFYLLGDTIIQEVVLMLDWMPAIVLTSKLCPTGVESTVYALLAGFQNFGISVASSLGVLALDVGGIQTPDDAPCDFSSLTLLIIVGHVVLPLLTIPLTFWLIPNAKMTDDLIGGLPMMADVKEGSDSSDADDSGDSNGGEVKREEGDATTSVEVGEAALAPSQEAPRENLAG